MKTLGSVDNASSRSRSPAVRLRDPKILLNSQYHCTETDRSGSRGQAAGRRNLTCQQTLIFLRGGWKKGALLLTCLLLNSCISDVWTGASLIYDRHNVYLKVNDFQLAASISRALYRDKMFKRSDSSLEIAVFNLDVLMVGHVPTVALRQEAEARIRAIPGIRQFFNQLEVTHEQANPVLDSWITTAIRSEILADSSIDPHHFKIVTADKIVYIMGNAMPGQAQKVIDYARRCRGVVRVVKLLKYYHLSDKP